MIAFHYGEAMKQAQELSEISEALQELAQKTLSYQRSELGYSWKGEGAHLFLQKTEELCKDISKTARKTAGIAAAVQVAAKAVKEAEEAAERAARNVGLS